VTCPDPIQDRLFALEDAERDTRELAHRSLDLALRLTGGFPAQDLPALADRAVRLAVVFHGWAERAAAELDDCITYLEKRGH
jgi:hypothetical protein